MVFNGCRSVWSSCLSWELHVSVWSESGGHQSGVMWRPQTMGDQCPEQDWPLLTSPAWLTISISKWRLQSTAQTCLCFGFQTGFTRQWFSQSGGDWKAVICNELQSLSVEMENNYCLEDDELLTQVDSHWSGDTDPLWYRDSDHGLITLSFLSLHLNLLLSNRS